jgi:hypothetical protein
MKRKLIEINQEYLIVCDNKQCDYKIKNPTGDSNEDISRYLNMPCPKCSENLLTEQDYLQSIKVLKIVKWFNKWFSWTMIFVPKKAKQESLFVKCHNGLKIHKEINHE